MQKQLITIFIVITISLKSFGQISISTDGGFILPSEYPEEFMIGLNLSCSYNITKQMRAGLLIGFYNWNSGEEEYGDLSIRVGTMPISMLYEYRFLKGNFHPYAGINAGYYRQLLKITGTWFGEYTSETGYKNGYGFAPVLGFEYNITDYFGLYLNAKYHFIYFKYFDEESINEEQTDISCNLGIRFSF